MELSRSLGHKTFVQRERKREKSNSEVSLDLHIALWSGGNAKFRILESSLSGEIELPMVSGVPESELSHKF